MLKTNNIGLQLQSDPVIKYRSLICVITKRSEIPDGLILALGQNTVFYNIKGESSPTNMDSNELKTNILCKLNEKQEASHITNCHFVYVLVILRGF